MTQLLVSVRNAVEVSAAIEGLADIVDVKEPTRGSLGCATPEIIVEVAAEVRSQGDAGPPLSLALGELVDWSASDNTSLCDAITDTHPQFLKLGLSGAAGMQNSESWIDEWQRIRSSIPGEHAWVAVAYADHENAKSPPTEIVLQAAIETKCPVLLIDTYAKSGMSLLDHLSVAQLLAIRQATSRHGIKLALAGRVTLGSLNSLLRLQPDIIAVRGAVCDQGDRTRSVRPELVREFRTAVQSR